MNIFLAPHPDDETLFGGDILLKEHPLVVVVCDCWTHEKFRVSIQDRINECIRATSILGCNVIFLHLREKESDFYELSSLLLDLKEKYKPKVVYAPEKEGGHQDHDLVSEASVVFDNVIYYKTYTNRSITGGTKKSEIIDKAKQCYVSQIKINPQFFT